MKTSNTILLTTCFFLAGIISAGPVFSARDTCTVKSVQGSIITLDCGDAAEDYKAGVKVEVKKSKSKKRLEGC